MEGGVASFIYLSSPAGSYFALSTTYFLLFFNPSPLDTEFDLNYLYIAHRADVFGVRS